MSLREWAADVFPAVDGLRWLDIRYEVDRVVCRSAARRGVSG